VNFELRLCKHFGQKIALFYICESRDKKRAFSRVLQFSQSSKIQEVHVWLTNNPLVLSE